MKVLLVWQLFHGDYGAEFYLIDNPSESDLEHLRKANSKIINWHDDTTDAETVYDYLTIEESYCEMPNAADNGKWAKFEIDVKNGNPITDRIDMIFTCGIIC